MITLAEMRSEIYRLCSELDRSEMNARRERADHETALGEANREIEKLRDQLAIANDEICALQHEREHGGPQ